MDANAEASAIIDQLFKTLEQLGYKCNADARAYVSEHFPNINRATRVLDHKCGKEILQYAEQVGGCRPGDFFLYGNAVGEKSIARVCSLYDLPEDMVNPFVVGFSGVMTVPVYIQELLREDAKKHNRVLPFLAIGKSGNKGLYESVFNRENGLMTGTEYQAYLNIMELNAPTEYVRRYETVFHDIDTAGNLRELYRFALEQKLPEVTYVLVSGQPWYDKRLLAEWMLALRSPEFAGVKINLIVVHCPLWLKSETPEGHVSEISLGYAAACLGPLLKDTITFDGKTESDQPERYLMPEVKEANWDMFKELICEFSNMGWPNYMELLYKVDHKLAVAYIMLSHIYALNSFTPAGYDAAIYADMKNYQSFLGGAYNGGSYLEYLRATTDKKYFD